MEKYEAIEFKNEYNLKSDTVYFLLKHLNFSENFIKHLRTTPLSILINEQASNLKSHIKQDDKIKILKNPFPATNLPLSDEKVEILFEDDDYLIINKPHLLSCMPSRSHYHNNLGAQICSYMKNKDENFVLRIINRLDKDTAGIVIVAKNPIAYNNLQDISKEYHAICEGKLAKPNFTINKPILTQTENGINLMKRVVADDGKPAVTHVCLIKEFETYSLLKLRLETGRTHQIRVHLSSENHPLVGDSTYNSSKSNFSHTFLLLKEVSFKHYRTKKHININIDYPDDWKQLLEK